MEPLTLFAIVTAVVLAAVIIIDWKGRPFQPVIDDFNGTLEMFHANKP